MKNQKIICQKSPLRPFQLGFYLYVPFRTTKFNFPILNVVLWYRIFFFFFLAIDLVIIVCKIIAGVLYQMMGTSHICSCKCEHNVVPICSVPSSAWRLRLNVFIIYFYNNGLIFQHKKLHMQIINRTHNMEREKRNPTYG